MQILPGTWDWIQSNLATSPLDPARPPRTSTPA